VIAAVVVAVVVTGLSGRAIEHDLKNFMSLRLRIPGKVMLDNTMILVIS
jgi:hypothetical protein